jgi:hypothetical protein
LKEIINVINTKHFNSNGIELIRAQAFLLREQNEDINSIYLELKQLFDGDIPLDVHNNMQVDFMN